MKVAFYPGAFKENQDGAMVTVFQLIRSLLVEKIEPAVWSYTPQHKVSLPLVYHRLLSMPVPFYPEYRFSLPLPSAWRQLKAFRPDIIHIAVPDLAGLVFLIFARMHGVPVVASFHTDFASYLKYYHLTFLFGIGWRYLARFYNRCNLIYAPTKVMLQALGKRGVNNVRIWPRGIDRQRSHPQFRSEALRRNWGAEGKKVILYAGRFVPYKDLDVFVRVYRRFKEENAEKAVFVLVGDGPLRKKLIAAMPDAVFPGYLHGQDLAAVFASSDIFLFPSTTETFGNVVQEALSSGLPAVVSDVGGCREVVESADAGLVTRAGDTEAFYRNCLRLIEDGSLYRSKRENGLAFVATRSWDAFNRQVISIYYSLSG